ncbi:MAG: hypothetical protein Q9160_005945 [Pyrenula sp. 1 TL-2023]
MPSIARPTIVLVHGSWHVPQHYDELVQKLQHAGFDVYCPLPPICDETKRLKSNMCSDVTLVRDLVKSLIANSQQMVMLLHSYGDAVGTEAAQGLSITEQKAQGHSGGITHLIFMCGFMLQEGESVSSASLPRPQPEPVEADEATRTTFPCEPPIRLFYADVRLDLARKMASLLVRQSRPAMTDSVTYAAWRDIPTTHLKTKDDQVMFPGWQDRQIKAVRDAGIEVTVEELESSHSPFVSMPGKMVGAVERAIDVG